MTDTLTTLKTHLQELILKSPAINSLPDEAKQFRINLMLGSKEEDMKTFIAILEEEQASMQKIEEDFATKNSEIQALVESAKQLEAQAEREIRKEKEAKASVQEQQTAANLLTKLDEISTEEEEQPKKKKGWFGK